MPENAYSDLAKYYRALVEQLASEARQAELLRNPTAVGTDREEIYRRFLERHVPRSCEVFRGGYIFNLEGVRSRQMDVIVTAGSAPRFEMGSGHQAIAPLGGTLAVAEVKSNLNKTTLYEALDNFADLPMNADPSRALNPLVKQPPSERFWDFPFKVVFATSGVEKTTLYEHLCSYYNGSPNIEHERRPSIIHVLGQYILIRITPDMVTQKPDGSIVQTQTPTGHYRWFDTHSDLSAMLFMFSRIQSNAFFTQQMIWKYDDMINPVIEAAQELFTK